MESLAQSCDTGKASIGESEAPAIGGSQEATSPAFYSHGPHSPTRNILTEEVSTKQALRRYQIQEVVNWGDSSVVFRAINLHGDAARVYALKVIPCEESRCHSETAPAKADHCRQLDPVSSASPSIKQILISVPLLTDKPNLDKRVEDEVLCLLEADWIPQTISLFDAFRDSDYYFLVFPFMTTSLRVLTEHFSTLPETVVQFFTAQLLKTLSLLHEGRPLVAGKGSAGAQPADTKACKLVPQETSHEKPPGPDSAEFSQTGKLEAETTNSSPSRCKTIEPVRQIRTIVHGDLTLENLLIDDEVHLILGDFGNAQILTTSDSENPATSERELKRGTSESASCADTGVVAPEERIAIQSNASYACSPCPGSMPLKSCKVDRDSVPFHGYLGYTPPESLKGLISTADVGRVNQSVDIWCLGLCVFECLFGICPYAVLADYEALKIPTAFGTLSLTISVAFWSRLLDEEIVATHMTVDCKDFLTLCLMQDPENRPSAHLLQMHPFIFNQTARFLTLRDLYAFVERQLMKKNIVSRAPHHALSLRFCVGELIRRVALDLGTVRGARFDAHPGKGWKNRLQERAQAVGTVFKKHPISLSTINWFKRKGSPTLHTAREIENQESEDDAERTIQNERRNTYAAAPTELLSAVASENEQDTADEGHRLEGRPEMKINPIRAWWTARNKPEASAAPSCRLAADPKTCSDGAQRWLTRNEVEHQPIRFTFTRPRFLSGSPTHADPPAHDREDTSSSQEDEALSFLDDAELHGDRSPHRADIGAASLLAMAEGSSPRRQRSLSESQSDELRPRTLPYPRAVSTGDSKAAPSVAQIVDADLDLYFMSPHTSVESFNQKF